MKSETTTAITAVKQDVHLREWAEQLEAQQAIVPISVPQKSSDIRIEKNGLQISLPTNVTQETLLALVNALC
ncbi:MAG: hypothetical protein MJ100_06375 [Ruminococcus sp.]|nr:hypothetical protein [Ruminococcus sp.]